MNRLTRTIMERGFVIFLFVFCFSQFAGAQYVDIEYMGSALWGYEYATEIAGNYAFCVMYNGLMVLDISDLTSPQYVSKLYLHGRGWDIDVVGSYAYIADGFSTLRIVDISDPNDPIPVSGCDVSGSRPAVAISVSGDYAYLANEFDGIHIINVSDPNNPYYVSTFEEAPYANDIYASEEHVYVSNYMGGFQIVDVSDPYNPSLAWSYTPPDQLCNGVTVDEGFAYLSSTEGLSVFDVTDPENAQLVGNSASTVVGKVSVDNNYAYLGNHLDGFEIFEVSDPFYPNSVYFDSETRHIDDIVIRDSIIYLCRSLDFTVMDISQPESPEFVGNYDFPSLIFCNEISGDYAYVGGWDGLYIVDISDDHSPSVTAHLPTSDKVRKLEVSDGLVYLAAHNSGLIMVDVTDPSNPIVLGTFEESSPINSVFIQGNYAYLAENNFGLVVVDISDPSNPFLVGSHELYGYTTDVLVEGEYAYVISETIGLSIINIADPPNLSLVGSIDYEFWGSERIYISGDYAYISAGSILANLIIVDISDPENPTLTSFTDAHGHGFDVEVVDNLALLALEYSGLKIYDVADPAYPEFLYSYQTPGWLYDVEVSENRLYMAAETGFLIFDFITHPGCGNYTVGDFNGSGVFNVADVVEAYSRLKTGLPEPGLECECPYDSGNVWAVAMDVNNSCSFNVADIVDSYSKLKTGSPELESCEDCPPAG